MSDVTCRGSFALGTACGRCSRCRREIESYNAMKSLRDKLNTPSSAISRIEELEAKLEEAQYEIDFLNAQLEAWQEMAPPATKGLLKKHLRELAAKGKLTGGKDDTT